MFGGQPFGGAPFAGIGGAPRAQLAGTATIAIGTSVRLSGRSSFEVQAGITITGAARLTAGVGLRAAATIAIAAGGVLLPTLRAQATIAIGTRANVAIPRGAEIYIGGVMRSEDVRLGTISIRDALNDLPNTCTFVCDGSAPLTGQDLYITYPGLLRPLFAGVLERVEHTYEGERPALTAWRVTAQDYTRSLTRTTINKFYPEQSATAIAIDLVAGTGITTEAVQAGLPVVVGGIEFLDQSPRAALTKLMQRIGGYWYVDYTKVLHAFTAETTLPPDPLVPGLASLMNDPPVTYDEDATQIRTRVIVTGGGSTTLVPVAAGATFFPLEDVSMFDDSGEARSGVHRFTYYGRRAGAGATNVGSSIAAPGSAPSAALSTTAVGGIVGAVRYKHTWKNASGETLAGPESNQVVGVAFAAPSGSVGVSAAAGLGVLAGTFGYVVTNVTAQGETLTGAGGFGTATAVAAPAAPSVNAGGFGRLVGTYAYAQTFVTQYGETTGSGATSRTAGALAAPGAPSAAAVPNTMGNLIGAYSYAVTFVTALGETVLGAADAVTAIAQPPPAVLGAFSPQVPGPLIGVFKYRVSFVSASGQETVGAATLGLSCLVVTAGSTTVSGDGTGASIAYAATVTHAIYGESAMGPRTIDTNKGTNPVVTFVSVAGCGWNCYSTGTTTDPSGANLYKIAEVPPGVSSITHTTQTGPQAGVDPSMGRAVQLSGIPLGPTGTVARRIYRTQAGGSTYFLVGQIADNTGTAFNDVAADDTLTVQAPATNLNGQQIAVTAIPTGPAGTVARRIYRTKAGGSSYFLVATLNNNTATAITDNTPDDALTQGAPQVSTAGGEQHTIGLATGPAGTTARRLYRTNASGGGTRQLIAEIPDNSTATFTDNVPDASGPAVPLVSTAGGQNLNVFSIPTGPAGTVGRRLYRTKAGGAAPYFLVAQLGDNTTTSYLDSTPDGSLGHAPPLVNDAGASAVVVTVPTGPAGTASRRLYRTEGGGSVYRFVTELRDNTTTSFLDTKADASLGDLPPDVSTIGALPGSTSLAVVSTAALPAVGWARIDSQIITWTGLGPTAILGIPASGEGSLKSGVSAGTSLVVLPMLYNVPDLTAPLEVGADVHVLVQRDDTAAQARLAAREGGGTGIVEFTISDPALTATAAATRAAAELAMFANPIGRYRYVSRDLKTISGKTVAINLPVGVPGSYLIQAVTIDEINIAGNRARPRHTVEASSVRFSFEDIFRRLIAGLGVPS